jgi:hypothetical protein
MVMMSPHTEISRAQVWQWVRHGQTLQDGRPVTREFVRQIVRGGRQGEDRDGEGAYAEGRTRTPPSSCSIWSSSPSSKSS